MIKSELLGLLETLHDRRKLHVFRIPVVNLVENSKGTLAGEDDPRCSTKIEVLRFTLS